MRNTIEIKFSSPTNTFEIEFAYQKNKETIVVNKYRNFGVYIKEGKQFNFDYEVIKNRKGSYFLNILNHQDFLGKKFRVNFSKFYDIEIEKVEEYQDIEEKLMLLKKAQDNKKPKAEVNKLTKEISKNIEMMKLNLFLYEQEYLLTNLFGKTFHIGPLRREPQRVYTASGAFPSEVGRSGKWAVDELITNNELQEKMKKWLKDFCIASDFEVKELRKGSKRYEINIKEFNTGVWTNLADVGFGSSQILPIIVEGFITKNSTVLIEQPEIHLHPKGQAIMGDLLVDIVNNQKNAILVETHSDLIISRVCTRIAKGDLENSEVAIYYFNPTENGTEIIDIGINKKGQFQNFPDGFFEERYEEALLKADYF